MTVVAVGAAKGGSGKSTTATTLAQRLANLDETWLLDFDSQGHCGLLFGLDPGGGVYAWQEKGGDIGSYLLPCRPEGFSVLPSDPRTRNIEYKLGNDRLRCQRLIEQLLAYETPYIVIDTASRGPLQEIALRAAEQVVVPFCLDQVGMQGMYNSLQMLKHQAPDATITLIPVRYDMRRGEDRTNLQRVLAEFDGKFGVQERAVVKERAAVMSAQGEGKSIWEFPSLALSDVRVAYELLAARVTSIAQANDGRLLHAG